MFLNVNGMNSISRSHRHW